MTSHVSVHFSRKGRGRGKMEVDHVTFRVYQFSSANVFTEKIKFLLKSIPRNEYT